MNTNFQCRCGKQLKIHVAEVPKKMESRKAKCPACLKEYILEGPSNYPIKVTLFTEDGQEVLANG